MWGGASSLPLNNTQFLIHNLFFVSFQISDTRVRERVPHQPLPHQKETDRDGSPAVSHWETN